MPPIPLPPSEKISPPAQSEELQLLPEILAKHVWLVQSVLDIITMSPKLTFESRGRIVPSKPNNFSNPETVNNLSLSSLHRCFSTSRLTADSSTVFSAFCSPSVDCSSTLAPLVVAATSSSFGMSDLKQMLAWRSVDSILSSISCTVSTALALAADSLPSSLVVSSRIVSEMQADAYKAVTFPCQYPINDFEFKNNAN